MADYNLIYDDTCPICLSAVDKISQKGQENIKLTPLSTIGSCSLNSLPPLNELQKEMHIITSDGKVFKGALAVTVLCNMLPGYKILGKILNLPIIAPLSDYLYRFIARNRYYLSVFIKKS